MAGYPYTNFRYKVEVDGLTGSFSEVSSFDVSTTPIEYREGATPGVPTPMKIPGIIKYGNITLKRGITNEIEFFKWITKVCNGEIVDEAARKTVKISLLDASGTKPVATWEAVRAWPTKYVSTDFKATGSEVAIETLELVHEGITRTL